MNTITHPQRIDMSLDLLRQLRRVVAQALPAVVTILLFAVIFAASVALRLATLGSTNPSIAATLHRVLQALGLAS
jgi:hypothetical protein